MDNMKPNKFTYSGGFRETCTSLLKTFDKCLMELNSVVSGKTTAPDEYAVCNAEYKFRYISPDNIAEFASNLMKVIAGNMISTRVADVEKFAVESATRFVGENDCDPFNWTTIMATGKYPSNSMTLNDLLVYCQNEFFAHTVLSKYEMDERRNLISKDFKTLSGLHISSNIGKIIDKLPMLMEKTDLVKFMNDTQQDVVMAFIEQFIKFAISLNISTIVSMINFCVPRSTYNTALQSHEAKVTSNSLLDDEYFKESVDESNHKPVYVILTDTKTPQSRPIKVFTKSKVCHASISMDSKFNHCYTFTQVQHGLTIEDMTSEKFKKMYAEIYVAYVTNDNYDTMKKYCDTMEENKQFTKYNWGTVGNMLVGKDKEAPDDFRQVCSSFVNNVFKTIGVNIAYTKTPNQEDIKKYVNLQPDQFSKIYDGSLRDLNEEDIVAKSKSFAKSKSSRTISEYVTECCLLKTNDINFNNKIPFNINMRNVVLQDMHPNFKDTVSAINFLLKDNRSPFSLMIQKYGTVDFKHKIDPDTIVRMFIGNPCCKFDNFSNYAEIYNRLDFHSDVNWLDKITYGDVYQASNYRRDALGNDNKHPIQVSLEMLYQMYCPCKCKTNEDLANNIRYVGEAMIGIAKIYKECGIENWELVRDILAVMGEIMTKSMIRLYNNHMAVIVAADAMDDTIVPGYMYNEYFLMEDGNTNNTEKPVVTVTQKANNTLNDANSTVKQKAAAYASKSKDWIRQMIQKFAGWINDVLAKAPMNFINNHKAEMDWVKNHNTLNEQVKSALSSGEFKPHVENWPLYKVPAKALTDETKSLTKIIKELETKPNEISIQTIKEKFYSQFEGLDVSGMMNLKNASEQKDRNNTGEQKALTNWVLYGNSKPQQTTTNTIDDKVWTDLVSNIVEVGPALTKIGEHMKKDISACLDDVKNRLNAVQTKTESYEDDITSYGNPFMEDGDQQPSSDSSSGGNGEKLSEKQLSDMFTAVQDISNVWCVGVQNAMDKRFYRTSYQLYKDVIAAYKQSNGNGEQQPQQQQQQKQPDQQTQQPTADQSGQTDTSDQPGEPV